MVQSMTGYGRAEIQLAPYLCTIEARSVNHRYLDLSLKLPRELSALEPALRKIVQGRMARGRVEVFVNLRELPNSETSQVTVRINHELAAQYYEALQELRSDLKLEGPVNLEMLTSFRELVAIEKVQPDVEKLGSKIREGLAAALDELLAMRKVEGAALLADIQSRLQALAERIDAVTERTPRIVSEFREKLRQRVAELLERATLDPERLEAEVVYLAERQDVTEEIVRLRSHLEHFESLTKLDEPIGRKLDFLLQEINRETNTVASKVLDTEVAQHIIEMKSLNEQIREQVQNLQ